MSHTTSTMASLRITTVFIDDRGRTVSMTEHRSDTYIRIRAFMADYIAANGLRRDSYGDSAPLFRGGVRVGHYTISRS